MQLSCRHCGSERLAESSWDDALPHFAQGFASGALIFDGAVPLPRSLTHCRKCGQLQAPSQIRQKIDEMYSALLVVAKVPDLDSARLEPNERPDVRVHLHGSVFGLEVTNIVRGGSSGVIQRARWTRSVELAAHRRWRDGGHAPVWVSLASRRDAPKATVDVIAKSLVDAMAHWSRGFPSGRFMLQFETQDFPTGLRPYLNAVTVAQSSKGTAEGWVSGFANHPEIAPNELQFRFDKKAPTVATYPSRYDGLWLLISAGHNEAQALEVTEAAAQTLYSGPFDRAFFVDIRWDVTELRVRDHSA